MSSSRQRATLVAALLLGGPAALLGQPGPPVFSKQFDPATIGPGGGSTLTFTISHQGATPVTDLAFVDVLPAAVVIATPSAALSGCGGTLDAPDGGSTITFADGTLGAFASCTIRVDVTGSTPGVHQNVSGDLTSSEGNSGSAVADLTIDAGRPGFTKAFASPTVPLGGRSTLTFTIDNTANPAGAANLAFTDPLPPGLVVAGPTQASTTCGGGALTAAPGSDSIAYGPLFFGDATVGAESSCAVSVDVVATAVGRLPNTSGVLTSTPVGNPTTRVSGRAGAVLEATVDPLHLIKAFVDDPAAPGAAATLRFTVLNRDRELGVSGITFTDDLDAALSGLQAVGPPLAEPCGTGSTLTGTSLLTLTGGNLPPEGSCTFDVAVAVPAGAPTGSYLNTTSQVTGDLEGSPVAGGPASDSLFVSPAPLLTKEFTDDPVGGGGSVTLELTLLNRSASFSASDIAFSDVLDPALVSASSLPADGFCGPGSELVFTPPVPPPFTAPARLDVTGASLDAGASCTFSVVLGVAVGTSSGLYPNVTSDVTAMVDGQPVMGDPATDDLQVVGAPRLTKEFTDDPAAPGGTVTLELVITHDESAPGDATAIALTDDLDATLAGLTAVGLPMSDVCGAGSEIAGVSTLSLTGGTLAPGESCVVAVTLNLPGDAPPGPHPNTTSEVTAFVLGVPTASLAATDDLRVAGIEPSKSFVDDPVIPGATVTLEFTLDNVSPVEDATDIVFTDSLSAVLSGLTATGLPLMDPCGSGSQLSGTTSLFLAGGSLEAGTSCTFSVVLQVPAGAPSETYTNTTSPVTATMAGETIAFGTASDDLVVDSDLLGAAKSFTDDPATPGGTVTLELTLSNLSRTQGATEIAFSDDLDAVLSGLAAVGLPAMDVCGPGSTLSGASLLTLTGGSLPPMGSCTFQVTLSVPADAPGAGVFTNTTSQITGSIGGLAVTGDPAIDELRIESAELAKSFAGPSVAGGLVSLGFTIENLDGGSGISSLGFVDDLDAVISGLAAVGLPLFDVCGAGSALAGTSVVTLTGGNLPPGGSCTFAVTLQVPSTAAPGTFPNVTSELTSAGLPIASPAADGLVIEPPPAFAKAFSPDAVPAGDPSTLTLTIDNSASSLAATALAVTDDLPAGIVVATPANAATTCMGGTLTAVAGSGSISYAGGGVAAGGGCTVDVDVSGDTPGLYLNVTGELTSSSGNSGTASAELELLDVVPPRVTNVDSILGTDGSIEECDSVNTAVAALLVTFDEAMSEESVTDPTHWSLISAGPDRDLSTTLCGAPGGDDVEVVLEAVTWDPGTRTALLAPTGPAPVADGPVRLFGCSGGALVDASGNDLDGDGDGVGGDDFVRTFRIDRFDALANGHLDCALDGWVVVDGAGATVTHSPDDLDEASISGSALFEAPAGGEIPALAQCAPVLPESIYRWSGFARSNIAGTAPALDAACEVFPSADCSGAPAFTVQAGPVLATPGVWLPFEAETPLMSGVHSAACEVSVLPGEWPALSVNVDDLSFDALVTSVLFLDGFESGDTSAWSTVVP